MDERLSEEDKIQFVQKAIDLEEASLESSEDVLGRKTFTRAEKRIVVPGIEIDNMVEVTDGLAPDELVVVQGQSPLGGRGTDPDYQHPQAFANPTPGELRCPSPNPRLTGLLPSSSALCWW
jgi:hypothetical protein